MEPQMLHLIDILEKDCQIVDGKLSRILIEIKALQDQYKRLESDREDLIYAINHLEEVTNVEA
jgi:hypothetical protein